MMILYSQGSITAWVMWPEDANEWHGDDIWLIHSICMTLKSDLVTVTAVTEFLSYLQNAEWCCLAFTVSKNQR